MQLRVVFSISPFLDLILAVLGTGVCYYLVLFYDAIVIRSGLPTTLDLIIGGLTIILVLEATRRIIGSALPIVVIVFLLYSYSLWYVILSV